MCNKARQVLREIPVHFALIDNLASFLIPYVVYTIYLFMPLDLELHVATYVALQGQHASAFLYTFPRERELGNTLSFCWTL